jgi:outer membrane lipoprotein SlyB
LNRYKKGGIVFATTPRRRLSLLILNTQSGGIYWVMRKSVISFIIMTLVAGLFIFAAPATSESLSVQAQERSYYVRRVVRNGRVRYVRVRKPSYYRRHRNRINVAAGTGAGALIGGLAGGGKGALIGAGIGAVCSEIYTNKLKKNTRRYKKIRRY